MRLQVIFLNKAGFFFVTPNISLVNSMLVEINVVVLLWSKALKVAFVGYVEIACM
jgi:hypothetical protein